MSCRNLNLLQFIPAISLDIVCQEPRILPSRPVQYALKKVIELVFTQAMLKNKLYEIYRISYMAFVIWYGP